MQYRMLGNSGAVVTNLALGTMTFGAECTEETSHALLDQYLEAGGNFIDTADVYSRGVSEEIIGRWLKSRPAARDQLIIATKGRFPMGSGPNDIGLSRRHLRTALDASLSRLGVDHIDLYQVHAYDALTPIEETLRFLDDAIKAGKIGYYGLSNYTGWQLTKAVHVAKAHGLATPVTLQPQYNLLARDIEHEIVPACLDVGMGILPWSPLGGGWLTGKYKRDETPTGATRLGENPNRNVESYGPRNARERTWATLATLEQISKAHSASMGATALAWLLAKPGVTAPILGVRTAEQLTDNLTAAAINLTPEDVAALDAASRPAVDDYPYGDRGVEQRHRKIEGGR